MKRLAYITYEFPPRGSTQSQHTAALAEGLARLGWEVVVFTVADPPSSMIDLDTAGRLEGLVDIRRSYSLEPTRLIQGLKRLFRRGRRPDGATPAAPAGGARGYSGLPRWAIRFVQAFFLPDEKIGWKPFAVADVVRVHRETPFHAALVAGPPFTAMSIGAAVNRRLGVPWVADLRDPIVNGYFFTPHTPFHRWWMYRFEARVVHAATRVVTATNWIEREIVSRSPGAGGRVEMLPNGFRRQVFDGIERREGAGFTIAYVGTFQATIRPDTFLDAVARLRETGSPAFADLRVRFVGATDPDTEDAIVSRGLDAVVERTGFVPQSSAYQAMVDADVLMITLGPEPASAGILTSKLPEYLGARKTVLALVPESEAGTVVMRAGAGPIVPPRDVAGAAAAIEELHVRWRSGSLPVPDPAVVAEFDRDRVIERFSELLHEVSGGASDGRSR